MTSSWPLPSLDPHQATRGLPLATHTQVATRAAQTFAGGVEAITRSVATVIQGKDDAIRLSLLCLFSEGHLLIEDVPGVGKTSLAKALANSLGCTWGRIQFTPDLLPSDVTGVAVFNRATNSFDFRPGGVFANIVLGDEINRASPKTQSALLEAMEERQVTVDATTYRLPSPFMVIATQNPVEHEGTYPLPESQLDRFLMRLTLGYPPRAAEIEMLEAHGGPEPAGGHLRPVATDADVASMIRMAQAIHVAPSLKAYIIDVANASRRRPELALGISPRAALGMLRTARARAASEGREYVLPDDIKALARPVIEHRLALTPEAQVRGITRAQLVEEILAIVPVPTSRG